MPASPRGSELRQAGCHRPYGLFPVFGCGHVFLIATHRVEVGGLSSALEDCPRSVFVLEGLDGRSLVLQPCHEVPALTDLWILCLGGWQDPSL